MEQSEPTISSILLELADEYSGIVSEREVFERVLARRPSHAKDPYASIRNKLRYDAIETGWVRLGGGELIPRQAALQGLRCPRQQSRQSAKPRYSSSSKTILVSMPARPCF